tara:strand:+ start:129 stop:443 length:315 start_codon:yes stop_codon:yes gene_type:complete
MHWLKVAVKAVWKVVQAERIPLSELALAVQMVLQVALMEGEVVVVVVQGFQAEMVVMVQLVLQRLLLVVPVASVSAVQVLMVVIALLVQVVVPEAAVAVPLVLK